MSCVLLADDDAVVRLLVSRRVRALGAEIVVAVSVGDAERVDPKSLSCALLDLDLGDALGTEIAARLRAEVDGLPIAFFTSEEDGDARTEAATYGPVFVKPAGLDEAITWIARHWGGDPASGDPT